MEYRGFIVDCEVETYERWTVGPDGNPDDWIEDMDHFEVTGYFFNNEELDIHEFQAMSDTDVSMLQDMCDDLIKEKELENAKV